MGTNRSLQLSFVVFVLVLFVVMAAFVLSGCGGCNKDGAPGSGASTPAEPDNAGPLGPGGPAAAGPDLTWIEVEMSDAQGQRVGEPTVGQAVNIYAVIYNNGSVATNSISATMSMDGVVVTPANNLSCDVRGSVPVSMLNYVFNAPGDHTLSLDITGCNPPEVGAAADPASNHRDIIIHVLPAGQAPPPQPGGPVAAGPDLMWMEVEIGDPQGNSVSEPTVGQLVNIYAVMYNNSNVAASGISATMAIDGVVVTPASNLSCDMLGSVPISALNYMFNTPGDHTLSLDITGSTPPEVGAAADPASNHKDIIIHVLPAIQVMPPPQPGAPAAAGPDLTWIEVEMGDAQGRSVSQPAVGQPVSIYAAMYNNGTVAANGISATMSMDGAAIATANNLSCDMRGVAPISALNYVFNTPGDHTLSLDITGCNPPEAGAAADPAGNHKDIIIHVLPAGQAPPPQPGGAGAASPDIIWIEVEMSDAHGQSISEPIVGQPVTIYAVMYNNSNVAASGINAVMKDNGAEIKRGNGLVCDPHGTNNLVCVGRSFATAGSHTLSLDITGSTPPEVGAAADPASNHKDIVIKVLPAGTSPSTTMVMRRRTFPRLIRVGPVCDLEVDIPAFWRTGGHVSNIADVGQSGVIKFNVSNRSGHDANAVIANLVVTKPDGSILINKNWTVDVPVHATVPLEIAVPALQPAGTYKMEVQVDNTPPYKTSDTDRPNNYSSHGFTVMAPRTASVSGGGEKMLTRLPDSRSIDIGFIPNGARDYLDEVYQGEKGSLYGAYDNNSDIDINNLKVDILVDGQIIRESVKPLLKAHESADFKVSNYWFNALGTHNVSLIIDPDNQIKEINEKNNRVSHTINVKPRQRPAAAYDNSGAAALTGLIGTWGAGKVSGGGGSYTPPTAPTYTTPTTPTTPIPKKPTPTFTAKGLGK